MIEEYHYKPTTLAKLRRAVRYGQNQLNLRDWQVELLVGGQPIGTAAQTDKSIPWIKIWKKTINYI